jgi:hypothetical protein
MPSPNHPESPRTDKETRIMGTTAPRPERQPVRALVNADGTAFAPSALCDLHHRDRWARQRAGDTPGYTPLMMPEWVACPAGSAECRECGEVAG